MPWCGQQHRISQIDTGKKKKKQGGGEEKSIRGNFTRPVGRLMRLGVCLFTTLFSVLRPRPGVEEIDFF